MFDNKTERRYIDNLDTEKLLVESHSIISPKTLSFEDFAGEFGRSEIEEDKKFVEERKGRFEENAVEIPEVSILKAVLHENIEKNQWLGPDVVTFETNIIDKIRSGIDIITKSKSEEESVPHLGLAIDVILTTDTGKMFNRIKEDIENGRMPEIKYFPGNKKGEMLKIPHVVIGITPKRIRELAYLTFANDKEALRNHPAQFEIMEQIIAQLERFKNHAESHDKVELAGIYGSVLNRMYKIYVTKQKAAKRSDSEDDKISNAIENGLHVFNTNVHNPKRISEEKRSAARARFQQDHPKK
jgi:hypothetical protein